jgi:hypothetical protein
MKFRDEEHYNWFHRLIDHFSRKDIVDMIDNIDEVDKIANEFYRRIKGGQDLLETEKDKAMFKLMILDNIKDVDRRYKWRGLMRKEFRVYKVETDYRLMELAFETQKEIIEKQFNEEIEEFKVELEKFNNCKNFDPENNNNDVLLYEALISEIADILVLSTQLYHLGMGKAVEEKLKPHKKFLDTIYKDEYHFILNIINYKVGRTKFRSKYGYYKRKFNL